MEKQSGDPTDQRQKSSGQVLVEMALMLPWFFTIIFSIMEMGNLAFHMILINHAAYETARFGAMTVVPPDGGSPLILESKLDDFLKQVIKTARIDKAYEVQTVKDPQADQWNSDLAVVVAYDVQLIFPISNLIFSKPPGTGKREIKVSVQMPIERPLKK